LKSSRSEFQSINGLRYHIRVWGDENQPKLFLLHGWMDVGASFQFLVDALEQKWCVIAPDWRGFGLSEWSKNSYYFPDYFADLDRLLNHYQDDSPVNLAGHSMGGNVAGIFAGVRPQRIAKLVLLEGFGLKPTQPSHAPARLAKWLDQLKDPPGFKRYASVEEFAARLQQNNKRLTFERAVFIAEHSCRETSPGKIELLSDPSHKLTNPVLYRLEEAQAAWKQITAPSLWITGADSEFMRMQVANPEDYASRKACFNDLHEEIIPDCGHMMHHDQPKALAIALETFFSE
jgi:pimeloyl-ACP methyl ester carboxylesterase